jgi:hypothetical protein
MFSVTGSYVANIQGQVPRQLACHRQIQVLRVRRHIVRRVTRH